jgi:hypothetical protein
VLAPLFASRGGVQRPGVQDPHRLNRRLSIDMVPGAAGSRVHGQVRLHSCPPKTIAPQQPQGPDKPLTAAVPRPQNEQTTRQ